MKNYMKNYILLDTQRKSITQNMPTNFTLLLAMHTPREFSSMKFKAFGFKVRRYTYALVLFNAHFKRLVQRKKIQSSSSSRRLTP